MLPLRASLACRRLPRRLSAPPFEAFNTSRRLSTLSADHTAPEFDLAAIRSELAVEHAHSAGSECRWDDASAPWHWLDREMSSNMAGEVGAVCIYDGAAAALSLRGTASAETLRFVDEHREAERRHLELIERLLPPHKHTRLLPMWRAAGFALGFAPALVSDRALFKTVEAVETFVEEHYGEQIGPLKVHGRCPQLVALLEHCCADEAHAGNERYPVEREDNDL